MTMACPRCQVAFQDGQICPHCGGYLVPYQPKMQPPATQQAYDYTQEPSYEDAEAPVVAASTSKGKTVAIAALSVLVAALTASCVFLLTRPAPEPGIIEAETAADTPTRVENVVAKNGFEYLSDIQDAVEAMNDAGPGTEAWDENLELVKTMGGNGYIAAVAAPIGAMSERYPELNKAWIDAVSKIPMPEAATTNSADSDMYAFLFAFGDYIVTAEEYGFDTFDWKA